MTKKQLNILSYIVFVGLAVFLVIWSFKEVDIDYVWSVLKKTKLWLLLFVTPTIFFSHWFRAVRWKQLTDSFHPHTKSFNLFAAVITGYILNLAFPRLGEVGKCSILAKYEKISPSKLIGTILIERIIDIIFLIALITLTLIIEHDIFYSFFYDNVITKIDLTQNPTTKIIIVIVAVLAIIGSIFFISKHPKNPIAKIIKKLWLDLKEGVFSIKKLQHPSKFIFLSFMIWLMYLLSTWISFYALDVTSHLSFSVSMPLLVMGSIGMIVTQGGVGAYWILIQQTLIIYGIAKDDGFAYGCLIWLAQNGLLILFGLLSWLILPLINKKNQD